MAAGLPGEQAHVFPTARQGYLHPVHPAGCHGHAPATPAPADYQSCVSGHHWAIPLGTYRIGAYTLGEVRDLIQNRAWQLGLGADVTMYSKPASLDLAYGKHPVSFQ